VLEGVDQRHEIKRLPPAARCHERLEVHAHHVDHELARCDRLVLDYDCLRVVVAGQRVGQHRQLGADVKRARLLVRPGGEPHPLGQPAREVDVRRAFLVRHLLRRRLVGSDVHLGR